MSKQELDQRTQNRETALANVPRGGLTQRGAYTGDMLLSPADFFRMTPFSLMRRMSEEMDRMFNEFGMNRGNKGSGGWSPAVEVSERDGKFQVCAELPGVNPSDVKLEVTDNAVILEGERKFENEENRGGMQLTERQYGKFYRVIPLPEGAKGGDAKAKFSNGVLEVSIPTQERKENRRQIPIETSQSTDKISQPPSGR